MQRTALILACIFICVDCLSQQYPFVHYTPKDGLINSRVKKAYQDSKGRMYFLTFGGLSVYDGARFKNYTTQNGLASNVVNDILEVGDDSLLVATNNEYNLNVLVKGKISLLKTTGAPYPVINQFYRHHNKIYLSSDNGLFVLENKKIRGLNVSLLSKTSPELPYLGNIAGVGNYLVLTTHELRGRKGLFLYDIKNNSICDALPKAEVYLIGKDNSNYIWVSMSDKLFLLDSNVLANGRLSLIPPMHGYQQTKDYPVFNVAFDKNCIWLVYRNKEYRNTDIRRIEETGVLFRMPLPEQATSSDIKNIIVDRENTIWLSSDGEGVFKIVNSPLQIFENPFGKLTQSQADNVFYSNNVTWYGTGTHKLFRKSKKGLVEFICNMKESPVPFYDDGKKLLARDARNIYEADLNDQKNIYFRKTIALPDYDFFVKKIVADRNGAIIASQKSGVGVWKNNKLVFHLPISKKDNIEELAFDKNNLLWVVKRHTGIDVFSLHPENISNYLQPVFHFAKEQIGGSSRSCVIDRAGLIWIGTRENGLIGYSQQGNRLNKLYHFHIGNGLTDNFVTSLACDSFNNIIAGTQTGLDRIVFNSRSSYRIENLSKSSNFFALIKQSWADSKQAYALSFSGVLLQVSSPANEKMINSPKLLLEEMRVNAQSVPAEKKKFRYKENNISFLVAAPSFIDEKQVAFSYLLEGSGNKQWSDTTPANSIINLTNLSAGAYLLKVKAFFSSTSYTPAELSYPFQITPPWWQTWWFRIGMAMLIVGILIIAVRFYYRRKLETQMAALEKQQAIEKERTRIATDMHDDLGAGLTRIKFITESFLEKTNDPALKPEAEKLRTSSNELVDKMGEIIWAMNDKNNTLEDLIFYLRSYAVDYCDENKLACEFIIPETIPQKIIGGQIRRNVFLVLKESLHNAVKHASAKKISIHFQVHDTLSITITDDGRGFEQNMSKGGNGLLNMRRRAEALHGKFSVSNDAGTTIHLEVPV